MATDDNDLTLRIKGEADLDPLTRATQVAEKKVAKNITMMQKATVLLGKKFDFVFKKTVDPALKRMMKEARAADTSNSKMLSNLAKNTHTIIALEKELKTATSTRTAEIHKAIAAKEDEIKASLTGDNKQVASLRKLAKAREHINELDKEKAEKQDRKFEEFVKYDAGEDIADGFKDALGSLGSKDLMGMGKGLMGAMGASMKGAGSAMFRKGTKMQMNPENGAGMQAFGKVLAKIGPAVAGLAKAATAIGGLVAGLGMIVKVMMDIEAAGKEANKELLQGTSLMEDFYAAGADAGKAFKLTKGTVDDMRKSTADIAMNLDFGTQAKEHREFLNTLKAEGLASITMEKSFQRFGIAGNAVTDTMKTFADISKTGIAYSRLFGVSLNDIASMEVEMIQEMGSSLASVQLDFARMGKAATESGIASNKFFAIIRGVSADLNLYNNRIEDAVAMLGKLGKVMSPRNAQKFFDTAQKGLKDMSEEDRLRMGLILGETEARKMATKEVKRHENNLQDSLLKNGAATADQLGAIFGKVQSGDEKTSKSGLADLERVISGLAPQLQGEMRGMVTDLEMDKNRMAKGGMMGIQEVMAKFSPAASQEATVKAMEKFSGGKKLVELTGIQAFAARKLLNVSQDTFEQQAKMESAIDKQRTAVVEALKLSSKDRSIEQQGMIDKLTKNGVLTNDGTDETSKVMTAGWADLQDTMTQSDQDALAASQEQVDYSKQTAQLTSTISDKLDTVIEGIFQFLYSIFEDMFDSFNDWASHFDWFTSSSKRQEAAAKKLQRDTLKSIKALGGKGNKIGAIVGGAKPGQAHAELAKQLGPQLSQAFEGMDKQADDLTKTLVDLAKAGQAAAGDEIKQGQIKNQIAVTQAKLDAVTQKKQEQGNKLWASMNTQQKTAAMRMAGLSTATEDFWKLTEQQKTAVLGKSLWASNDDDLQASGFLDSIADLTSGGGGGGATTAQAKAGQAAANPGTQGAPPVVAPASAAKGTYDMRQDAAGPSTASAGPATPASSGVTQKQSEEQHEAHVAAVKDEGDATRHALKMPSQGVAINKSSVKQTLSTPMQDAVYEGTSQALFEYFMYSKIGQDKIAMALQRGASRKGIVGAVNSATAMGQAGGMGGAEGAVDKLAPAHARGGVVMRPPPGEAFTSVAPGERIIPAGGGGGGGGKVVLELKGDMLKQIIRATAHDAIHEHESKKKLR